MQLDKIEELRKYCVGPSGKIVSYHLQDAQLAKNPHIVELVNGLIQNEGFTFGEKVKLLVYNNGDLCKFCSTRLTKIGSHSNPYACRACAWSEGDRKRRAANLEKFGVEYASQSQEVQERVKESNIERFGVERPAQSNEVRERMRSTTMQRYGVENAMQNQEVRRRAAETLIERHGVENPFQCPKIREKSKATMVERHGVNNPLQKPEFLEKVKRTNLERYGAENPMQNEDVKNRSTAANSRFWKNTYPWVDEDIDSLYDEYVKSNVNLTTWANSKGLYPTTIGAKFRANGYEILQRPVTAYGKVQTDLANAISERTGIQYKENDRTALDGKEIDILFPEHNVGVEYHGVYWHSTEFKGKNDHRDKFLIAKEMGIRLFQFFSTEVEEKEQIVISMVSNALGCTKNRIGARHCKVIELENSVYTDFCIVNHLQGAGVAKYRYGLMYEDKLVAVMSFASSRYDGDVEYEMIRYCTALDTIVSGGASKLWKHFVKTVNPESVVTYADVRISNGDLYRSLGFTFSHHSQPNYYYTKGGGRSSLESRVKYQKHKLTNMPGYDESLSEHEIMTINGYHRVYDAGNYVFKWRNEAK